MKKRNFSLRGAMLMIMSFLTAICLLAGAYFMFPSKSFAEEETVKAETGVASILEKYTLKNSEPIVLSGTREEIAAIWSANMATADRGAYTYFKLESDWIAEEVEGKEAIDGVVPNIFGEGAGFWSYSGTGRSVIEGTIDITGKHVILDLNGHVIDRGHNEQNKKVGNVFYISSAESRLVLVDSNPTAAHLDGENVAKYTYDFYDAQGNTQKVAVTGGVITGGNAVTTSSWGCIYGGAIRLFGGQLDMYGGAVYGNRSALHGGGIYAASGNNSGNITDKVMIDGGSIVANGAAGGSNSPSAPQGGGVWSSMLFEFKSGVIADNSATTGGGICVQGSKTTVSGGEIINNVAEQGAGVYNNAVLEISGGKLSYNSATGYGGAVYSYAETTVSVSDGEISDNFALMGGAIYTCVDLTLNGGTIVHNRSASGYYSEYPAVQFNTTDGVLYIGGPVILKENGSNSSGYSIDKNIGGDLSEVIVTGKLEKQTPNPDEPDNPIVDKAEIYISPYYCPIKDYAKYNPNTDSSGSVDPNEYFFFSYLQQGQTERDTEALDTVNGVICSYKLAYSYFHYSAAARNWSETSSNDRKTSAGDGFMYGATVIDEDGNEKNTMLSENGEHGVKIKLFNNNRDNDFDSWFLSFYRYEYDSDPYWTEEDKSYINYGEEIKDAGIYVCNTYYNGNYVKITITVRPKEIGREDKAVNGVTVICDQTAKEFTSEAWEPWATENGDQGVVLANWLEKDTHTLVKDTDYTVTWENNTHVGSHPAYIVVKGKGNYAGTIKLEFNITKPLNEVGDASSKYELTDWEYYNGTEWVSFKDVTAPLFTYYDKDYSALVRAKLTGVFHSGNAGYSESGNNTYTAYVYAENVPENLQHKDGDDTHTDPGLKLVFAGTFGGATVNSLLNATTYTVTVAEAHEWGGNFGLPEGETKTNIIIKPFEINLSQSAFTETDVSLLAVEAGESEIPLLSNVTYVQKDGTVNNGTIPFNYVLFNGKAFTVKLNSEFVVDFNVSSSDALGSDAFGKPFMSYVVNTEYQHYSIDGQTEQLLNSLLGVKGDITTVKTKFMFTLNSNFAVAGGTEVWFEKTWNIVTKYNEVTTNATDGEEYVYGSSDAIKNPSVQYGETLFVTLSKGVSEVAKVVVQGNSLFVFSETAADNKGEALTGAVGAYFDGIIAANGVGEYTVKVEAPDYVSEDAGENGAVYASVAREYSFTVTARAINDLTTDGKLTLSVNAGGLVYTGKALEAVISIKLNGKELVKDTDYTVTYSNNVNAGTDTATLSIEGKGNFKDTYTYNFSIAQATDNDWTTSLNLTSWVFATFNREINKIYGTSKYGSDTVKFEISVPDELKNKLSAEQLAMLANAAVEDNMVSEELAALLKTFPVGDYTLKASVEETGNYNELDGVFAFRVLPNSYTVPTLDIREDGNLQNNVYSGGQLSMNILGFDSAAMEIEVSEGLELNEKSGSIYATKAGSYTVTLTLKDPEACAWVGEVGEDGKVTLTWVISPKKVMAPIPNGGTYIINGQDQTYIPIGYNPELMRIENNVQSEAGNHNVRIYLLDPDNYIWDYGDGSAPATGVIVIVWEIQSSYELFIIVICILAGLVLIAGLCALGQYLKHNARMADLAAADANSQTMQEIAEQPVSGSDESDDEEEHKDREKSAPTQENEEGGNG